MKQCTAARNTPADPEAGVQSVHILTPCMCAQKMDPQMRKLLEVTHEAFVDSGVDYKALRGSSRVGVYLGCCGSEVHAMWLSDYNNITGYEQTGCTLSMFANRLSFFFDFKGPSKAVDTGNQLPLLPSVFLLPKTAYTLLCLRITVLPDFDAQHIGCACLLFSRRNS